MSTRKLFSLTALTVLLVAGAQAQVAPSAPTGVQATAGEHLAVGVIRAVDMKTRAVTITHQAIAGVGMSAMTMPFRLDERIPISSIKTGDTVAFLITANSQEMIISSLQSVVAARGGKSTGQGKPEMMQGMQGMQMMDECREMMKQK